MYGLALDLIIDEDDDLVFDDIDGDKQTTIKDAQLLLKYVQRAGSNLRANKKASWWRRRVVLSS
jgi:hypothetical protein